METDWLRGATVDDLHQTLDQWDAWWSVEAGCWIVNDMTDGPDPDLAHVCPACASVACAPAAYDHTPTTGGPP